MIFSYLSEEQRAAVMDSMRAKLPVIIRSAWDFNAALSNLSAEQRTAVIDSMRNRLPAIIQSYADLAVLAMMSHEQSTWLYDKVKIRLPYFPDKIPPGLFDTIRDAIPEAEKAAYCALPSLMRSLEQVTHNKALSQAFASALMSQDSAVIFEQLAGVLQGPNAISKETLLSKLDPLWRARIEQALAAHLSATTSDQESMAGVNASSNNAVARSGQNEEMRRARLKFYQQQPDTTSSGVGEGPSTDKIHDKSPKQR